MKGSDSMILQTKIFILMVALVSLVSCGKTVDKAVDDAKKDLETAKRTGDYEAAVKAEKELDKAKEALVEQANNTTITDELITDIHNKLLPDIPSASLEKYTYLKEFWYVNTKYFIANINNSDADKKALLKDPEAWLSKPENVKAFVNNYAKVTKNLRIRLSTFLFVYFSTLDEPNYESYKKATEIERELIKSIALGKKVRESSVPYTEVFARYKAKEMVTLNKVYQEIKASK